MFRWNCYKSVNFWTKQNRLNSTMFRWNFLNQLNIFYYSFKFKFHYVQMKLPPSLWLILLQLRLNSTMFRWNTGYHPLSPTPRGMFKFHYVQMKHFIAISYSFKVLWFKFHYVQMKPPFLTFQTYFNKA